MYVKTIGQLTLDEFFQYRYIDMIGKRKKWTTSTSENSKASQNG